MTRRIDGAKGSFTIWQSWKGMNKNVNRIKIVLSGKEYTIQTEESSSYVKQLAEALDAKIDDYMSQNDSISVTSACMLVALGLMDDSIKAASDKENLRKQVIDYLEEATKARTEIMEMKKELEALKQKNEMMAVKLLAYGDKEVSRDEQSR